MTKLGYEAEEDVPGALDRAEQDRLRRRQSQRAQRVCDRSLDLLFNVFQDLERRHEQKGDRTGVTAGYPRHRRLHRGLAARQPDHRGGAPGDGQNVARAQHGGRGGEGRDEAQSRFSRSR
jgi:replicative DNA helicase